MTGNPVADELLDQIETYHRKTAELSRRLKEHPDLLPRINLGLQDLIDIQLARPRLKGDDLFKAYRKVRGLIFIGPREWEKACLGPKKENPLELEPSWCHKLKLPPPLPIEVMRKVASYCRTPEWATTPVLWLALPRIVLPKFGEIPTTLLGQNKLWGVAHDNLPGGLVRQDVFWSNWFMAADYTAKYELAHEPATKDNGWAVGYEFPDLTVRKNWPDQKVAISQRKGLESVTPARCRLVRRWRQRLPGLASRDCQRPYRGFRPGSSGTLTLVPLGLLGPLGPWGRHFAGPFLFAKNLLT